jgi:hypothetical protein
MVTWCAEFTASTRQSHLQRCRCTGLWAAYKHGCGNVPSTASSVYRGRCAWTRKYTLPVSPEKLRAPSNATIANLKIGAAVVETRNVGASVRVRHSMLRERPIGLETVRADKTRSKARWRIGRGVSNCCCAPTPRRRCMHSSPPTSCIPGRASARQAALATWHVGALPWRKSARAGPVGLWHVGPDPERYFGTAVLEYILRAGFN